MSNYYYENKAEYLQTLASVRAGGHDLTPFLVFGLKGIALQCKRLFAEIRAEMLKALFRNTMYDLFNRLESSRKRVVGKRHLRLLNVLLETGEIALLELWRRSREAYAGLKSPVKALERDISSLETLRAISVRIGDAHDLYVAPRLDWPTEITESEFMRLFDTLPRGKTYAFFRQS